MTLGTGPAITASIGVPDLHYFRGSFGGKDVVPLYRDQEAAKPNITRGLLDLLTDRLGSSVSPEDLAAYCFALAAHDGYTTMFWDHLEHSAVRIPPPPTPNCSPKQLNSAASCYGSKPEAHGSVAQTDHTCRYLACRGSAGVKP
ncbi:hypothetical protein GS907_26070 [Rhodococcus hoagii]|nr:hypothetical protein [Prescottella equi]